MDYLREKKNQDLHFKKFLHLSIKRSTLSHVLGLKDIGRGTVQIPIPRKYKVLIKLPSLFFEDI